MTPDDAMKLAISMHGTESGELIPDLTDAELALLLDNTRHTEYADIIRVVSHNCPPVATVEQYRAWLLDALQRMAI